MSAPLTEQEIAFLKAVAERLNKPFRPEKDTGELSRARSDYQARMATCHTLIQMGAHVQYLDEALHDLLRNPDESEVDLQLTQLWQRVCEIFPGITPPAC